MKKSIAEYINIFNGRIDDLSHGPTKDVCKTILKNIIMRMSEYKNIKITDEDIKFVQGNLKFDITYVDLKKHMFTGKNNPNYNMARTVNMSKNDIKFIQEYNDRIGDIKISNMGCIMNGPPGNGKTRAMRVVQKVFRECGHTQFNSEIIKSAGFGAAEIKIQLKMIDIKRLVITSEFPFCLVYFDEVDVMRDRTKIDQSGAFDGGVSTTNFLMTRLEMDDDKIKTNLAYWVTATNLLSKVDGALKRKGRLGDSFVFPNPVGDILDMRISTILDNYREILNVYVDSDTQNFMKTVMENTVSHSDISPVLMSIIPEKHIDKLILGSKIVKKRYTLTDKFKIEFRKSFMRNISMSNKYSSFRVSKITSNQDISRFTPNVIAKMFEHIDLDDIIANQNKLEITIKGARRTGKTTLALKMVEWLDEYGFNIKEKFYVEPGYINVSSNSIYISENAIAYVSSIVEVDNDPKTNQHLIENVDTNMRIIITIITTENQRNTPTVTVNDKIVDYRDAIQ